MIERQDRGKRLEQYTARRLQEVLLVSIEIDGELDEILIYRGFSSSLVRSTAFDPEVPVLPAGAKILKIDRIASPYNSKSPNYIQQGLTWEEIQSLLTEVGV